MAVSSIHLFICLKKTFNLTQLLIKRVITSKKDFDSILISKVKKKKQLKYNNLKFVLLRFSSRPK